MINQRRMMRRIASQIQRAGRMIIGVDDRPFSFAYTIGNTQIGLPEILILGVASDKAAYLLNRLSDRARLGNKALPTGQDISIGGTYPVRLIMTDDRLSKKYTLWVSDYYGHSHYTTQQVVIPDANGIWPGQLHCDPAIQAIPLLMRKLTKSELDVEDPPIGVNLN